MAFVIQGAFKVENRVVETRNELALWNTGAVAMEALLNSSILLLFEIKYKN